LKRGEATQLLREILNVCSSSIDIRYVSLNSHAQNKDSTGYQLRIGTQLDTNTRNSLAFLLEKNGFEMEELKDIIVIHKPRK
jgi:hypothetical protein